MTLTRRRAGITSQCDTQANSMKLTELEEEAIVEHIIDLSSRSFHPGLRGVEEMANHLLRVRDASSAGKKWASNFIKRQPKLDICRARKYDYQS